MEQLTIKIRAKHCITGIYESSTECNLAQAIKEQLSVTNFSVGPFDVGINNKWYKIEGHYLPDMYDQDKKKASKKKHPEAIVRIITLTKIIHDRPAI